MARPPAPESSSSARASASAWASVARGPVGRLAQLLVTRRAFHLGPFGRVLGVRSFLSRALAACAGRVEGVSHALQLRRALSDASARFSETRGSASFTLAKRRERTLQQGDALARRDERGFVALTRRRPPRLVKGDLGRVEFVLSHGDRFVQCVEGQTLVVDALEVGREFRGVGF